MEIEIVSRDFPATEAIQEQIRRKLLATVVWDINPLEAVRVTIGDTNGPRGGIDKYCRVFLRLVGGRHVHVEHVSDDLYDAIARACERTERSLLESHSRRRQRERQHRPAAMTG